MNKTEKKENAVLAVGIDVAKSTLSVCVRFQDETERALTIRNTETEIKKKLLSLLISQHCTAKTVMESTGHYHWKVALLLSEFGMDVRVVNPILAKQYTSANIRKVKTDPADAKGLCRMALVCEKLPKPFCESKSSLYLKKKFSVLASLSKQLQALEAMVGSLREAQEILEMEEDSIALTETKTSIRDLKKSMRLLERECVREAKKDTETKEQSSLLESIPGVSDACSILSLQWFHISENTTPKSWIAYAGLDVSSRESGTWKGQCRLTKRGNAYLRKRLYGAAWGAVMNDDDFKEYYTNLREKESRAHVEALTIISRKIVRIMYRLLQKNESFNRLKFLHKYQAIEGVS